MAEMKKKIHGFSTSIFQGREDKRTKRQQRETRLRVCAKGPSRKKTNILNVV